MAVLFCLILSSLIWALPASATSDTVSNCPKCGLHTIKIRPLNEPTCVDAGRGVQVCTNNLCRYEGAYVTLPAKGHSGAATNGDCTKQVKCSACGSTMGSRSSHIYASGSDTKCSYPGCSYTRAANSKIDANVEDMNTAAVNAYKVIRSICVPLAIISLASCGFTFLGSIFFGNYSSMAGGDMMKAKKQAVYTVLAIMFIVLLPKIFSWAIGFFSATGWKPAQNNYKWWQ